MAVLAWWKYRLRKYLTVILFAAVLGTGLLATLLVYDSERKTAEASFGVVADEFANRVDSRLNQHIALITATGAFIEASGAQLNRRSFSTFIRGLRLHDKFEGIRGIGFAALMPANAEAIDRVPEALMRNYGVERAVWPETDQLQRAVIMLLEPHDTRNAVALGYDMFSEERRRVAMRRALETGRAQASGTVQLVQEVESERQPGFLIYAAVNRTLTSPAPQGDTLRFGMAGFAYAPFRASDFFEAILSSMPEGLLHVTVRDTTEEAAARERAEAASEAGGQPEPAPEIPPADVLYSTHAAETANWSGRPVERHIASAGREWTLSMRPGPAYVPQSYVYTIIVATISFLLAVTLAMAARWQARAINAIETLHAVSQQTISEKDLMLQEMKHRIKNSLARILAMARQTAAHSETLDAFKISFFARLQAMANAQEMLTRSHWQRADLRKLLETELRQVFGEGEAGLELEGPPVELNESATQALGLTFHELATNALKYGDQETGVGHLSVSWRLEPRAGIPWLALSWRETTSLDPDKVSKPGFGTRLIDASIRMELGGTIERIPSATMLEIRIEFPLRQ